MQTNITLYGTELIVSHNGEDIDSIVLVHPQEDIQYFLGELIHDFSYEKRIMDPLLHPASYLNRIIMNQCMASEKKCEPPFGNPNYGDNPWE